MNAQQTKALNTAVYFNAPLMVGLFFWGSVFNLPSPFLIPRTPVVEVKDTVVV